MFMNHVGMTVHFYINIFGGLQLMYKKQQAEKLMEPKSDFGGFMFSLSRFH